ncbi:MAG: MCE family protein [Acidobacteria bacterium]|nr:MCE family protein [Acidobacteriota bacterium]
MPSSRNFAVGLFLIVGILLFAVGLFMIGDRRKLFSQDFELYAEFKELSGLQNGADVKVGGMAAGEVIDIEVPPQPQSKFRVKMRIIEKLHPVVRTDSIATIQTEGVLGNKFLKIDQGAPQAQAAPPGSTIPSREPFDFADLLQQIRDTVEEVQGKMGDVFASISTTSGNANALIESVRGDVENIISTSRKVTDDVQEITDGIRAGRGTVGRLLNDEKVADSASKAFSDFEKAAGNTREISQQFTHILSEFQERKILQEIEQITKNVRQLTGQAKDAITDFQAKGGKGESLTGNLSRTITSAGEAMSSLAENMEALKRSFFFRGFFKNRGFYDINNVTVAEYREGKFAAGKLRQQAWIYETELFAHGSDGSEELSAAGKSRLDAVMAEFQRYLRNSAIIVEGYSGKGLTSEQFLLSTDRALKVREYLVEKFRLDPNYVGTMPMGAVASKDNSGTYWEGVAVVVFYDKPD